MSSYEQKRWEYKVVLANKDKTLYERELSALGSKGWELVSFSHLDHGLIQYIFKQEIDPLTPRPL